MENPEDPAEQPNKKKSCSLNFKTIDENFMSQPKYIPVLYRFIQYINSENLTDEDMQNDEKIVKLLQHAFDNNKTPNAAHVKSVKALFKRMSIKDFKRHLYRYSDIIATYLWVDRVQKIVTDPKEKSRILRGEPVNSCGYKLYCYLRKMEFYPQKDLTNNREVQLFRNILKATDEQSDFLECFMREHFKEDFSDEEKNEIINCTRKFLAERIKKKSRRCTIPANSNCPENKQDDDSNGSDNEKEEQNDPEAGTAAQEAPPSIEKKTSDQTLQPSTSGTTLGTEKEVAATDLKKEDPQERHSTLSRAPEIVIDLTEDNDDDCDSQEEKDSADVKDESEVSSEQAITEDENDRVLVDDHRRAIIDGLYRKWKNQQECNVEFVTAENRRIKAHKLVLSAGSPVFTDMFNKPSGKVDSISVPDLSYDVVEEMLHFMYSGKVRKLNHDKVCGLLLAAKKYEIGNLKVACEKYLIKSINVENAVLASRLSEEYELEELKNVSDEFIKSNAKQVCLDLILRKEFDETDVHYSIVQNLKSSIAIPS